MSGTVLTNKGLALITKLVAASTELQISRVAVGTGRVPSGVDPQIMVDLNEYKMDAQIESYGVSPDQSDVAYIAAQVSSIGVSAGFAVTEAGVFATDPDIGEILYAYLDLTEDPQYIYAETDAISKFAEITFNVLIGSVAKVTTYVSPGALTKKVDFNAFKESVETPEFDDSGTVEGISSFPSFLETMKSKMNFFQFFRNLKAGLQFVLHAGQIVNNCVTDNAGLPLSAAQGKVLKDLYTQLYSEVGTVSDNLSKAVYTDDIFITADLPTFVYWNGNTRNTPFKAGLTECQEGFAFRYGAWADYMTVVCFVKNDSTMWIWSKSRNAWVEYAAKSDLSPIGTVFWSGLEEIQCVKDTWVSGQMTITLPAGTYVIFGHAVLDAGTSTGVLKINNAKAVEAYQTYYSSVYRRQVTVSCFFDFTEQVTLSVGLFDSANTKATTCEVCAVRIK